MLSKGAEVGAYTVAVHGMPGRRAKDAKSFGRSINAGYSVVIGRDATRVSVPDAAI